MCYNIEYCNFCTALIMKLLFDFFPVLMFFLAYKLFGIYAATITAIVASVIQVFLHYTTHKSLEKMHIITLLLLVVFGGATLIFHDPVFIKMKPSVLYWLSGLIFLGSHFIGDKTVIQRMLEKNLSLKQHAWAKLNLSWGIYFVFIGFLNLYVASQFDTATWVNFKLFGVFGLTLVVVLVQSVFMAKHVVEPEKRNGEKVI